MNRRRIRDKRPVRLGGEEVKVGWREGELEWMGGWYIN